MEKKKKLKHTKLKFFVWIATTTIQFQKAIRAPHLCEDNYGSGGAANSVAQSWKKIIN